MKIVKRTHLPSDDYQLAFTPWSSGFPVHTKVLCTMRQSGEGRHSSAEKDWEGFMYTIDHSVVPKRNTMYCCINQANVLSDN